MSDPASPVLVERRGTAAIVTLSRPDRANALSRETIVLLGRVFRELGTEPSVRVIVLTGAGDRAFCAGADLKERRDFSEHDVREQLGLYRTELGVIASSPKPVIAAINGVALGGGLELALLCDLRVAAPHASFALPETTLGIIPGAGGTQTLPRVVGEGRAKEMILLGRRVNADEALAWGLINRISSAHENLVDDVLAWAAPMVEGAPVALGAALRAIDASFEVDLASGLAIERDCYEETLRTSDRVEALRAFAEKRRPTFRGV
jgi:methylglutaconyl-CoA hydratase